MQALKWKSEIACGATSQIYSSQSIYSFTLKEGALPDIKPKGERIMNHKYAKRLNTKKCS